MKIRLTASILGFIGMLVGIGMHSWVLVLVFALMMVLGLIGLELV